MAKEKNIANISQYISIKNIIDGQFSLKKREIIEISLSEEDLRLSPTDIIAQNGDKIDLIDLQKQFHLLNIIKGNLVQVKEQDSQNLINK